MRRFSFLIFAVSGCAHLGSGGGLGDAPDAKEVKVERIETPAGAFLVRESVSPDFKRLLAGEATEHPYYAGGDPLWLGH
jgi:hypothetical protein